MFRAVRHFIQIIRSRKLEIVGDKSAAIVAYREMLASQTQRIKSKKGELNRLSNDIQDLEKHCRGAQLMAQEIVKNKKNEIEAKLSRGDITQAEAESELQTIEDDDEFNYCWTHYTRTKEAIETKKKLKPVLEQEIQDLETKIVHHEAMLAAMEVETEPKPEMEPKNLTITEEKIGDSDVRGT